MNPYCSNRERYSCNVEVKESLVESVADGRWRVQQDENKRGRALECQLIIYPSTLVVVVTYDNSPHNHVALFDGCCQGIPPSCI